MLYQLQYGSLWRNYMMNIGSPSLSTVSQNIANLPKYNTNVFRDLPADAAPEGILADGGIYYSSYALLTPSDTALIESVTGHKSIQGDPLAGAIGTDRADVAIGWAGGLTGDVTVGYLQSIEASLANSQNGGTYNGFQISSTELSAAISYLTAKDENPGSTSKVSFSA